MAAKNKEKPYGGKWMLSASAVFSAYLLNVLTGKAALVWNLEVLSSILIGDVTEFLLLLLAIVFFTIEILRHERLAQSDKG